MAKWKDHPHNLTAREQIADVIGCVDAKVSSI
jgi:hypothetical protein